MVKRESVPAVDVDAPRPKRRKDAEPETPAPEDADMPDADASSERDEGDVIEGPAMSAEEVTEEGSKVWQIVKDAADKEGRRLATIFLHAPSKRQYPDYYEIIKKPIALDEIKEKLDRQEYFSLEEVRQDFELCFKNARKYNQRESVIWKDAKTLQKLTNKEIDKIVSRGEEEDVDVEGSDGEGGKKKKKGVNIHRLMKNRLMKLIGKTDDNGRKLCVVFMDLPSKKKWPVYYKLIKQPISIDEIFKRIKRKEYATVQDFIDAVDLVFSNAMEFNEEHSEIWEDAMTMKQYFHQIMTTLPAKYNMNGAGDSDHSASPEVASHKIMLKVPLQSATHGKDAKALPAPLQNSDSNTAVGSSITPIISASQTAGGSGGGKLVNDLKVSGITQVKKSKVKSPPMAAATIPAPLPTASSSSPAQSKATLHAVHARPQLMGQQPAFSAALPPASYQYNGNHYAPQSLYQASITTAANPAVATAAVPATSTPVRTSTTPAPMAGTSISHSSTPVASIPPSAAGIRYVRLITQPLGRKLDLDSEDGVKTWAMRLGGTENKLVVRGVRFAGEDEMDTDQEGVNGNGDGEGDKGANAPITPQPKRGRGRPRKVQKAPSPVKEKPAVPTTSASLNDAKTSKSPNHARAASRTPSIDDVLVRLDGMTITPKADATVELEWDVDINPGSHVLEVGKKGNTVFWKIYLERRSA